VAHCPNGPRFTFRVAVGLLLAVGVAKGAPPRDGPPITVEVSSLQELKQAAERATPGSVIRLSAGTYQVFAGDPPIRFSGPQGLRDQPIIIQGAAGPAGSRPTIIDGSRRLDRALALVEQFGPSGGRSRDLDALIAQNQYRTAKAVNCLVFEGAANVIIEGLTIRNCWPTSAVFLSSHYVTLRANTIVGSTYPFFVDGQSDHFVVEDSVWTQDDSGYAPDESGYSGHYELRPKPGRMWDTIPWGVAHHGSRAYLNGGLIGSFGTRGDIVVRHNVLRNAYNGLRMRANRCEYSECNVNVEIYDNDFQFIRDNPIEPEDHAINWWIHHNRIYNAHAWFSLDGVGGGPIYIFGNVGWFDDKPSRRCVPSDWAADRTLQADGYAPTADNECSRSRTGKVIKLGPGRIELKEPIYVFNNSWYVRAPLVEGGIAKFRAWNNATLFCDPDEVAPGMCVAEFRMGEQCAQSAPGVTVSTPNRFPIGLDQVPFIDCFAAAGAGATASDGISNHPDFPEKLAELGYPVSGLHADPGFADPRNGDFRLRPDSLARGSGCTVTRAQDGSLTCVSSSGAMRPDMGAYQQNVLIEGPDYIYRGDERPRVMKAAWRLNDAGMLLELAFSTVMQAPSSGTRVGIRLEDGKTLQSEPCGKVRGTALDCRFSALRAPPGALAALLIPRSLKSATGRPVTLWAAGVPRVELQP
jgi:hypothetical protein